ncbi:hypothetical protein SAICODRAFT_171909 [Saitoella complicata NRRL Y-17804]|uniref:uncharacterized protein n=1 Tax=Saitoella complicata (strain BCRC 22490 / CBS 7301 / JCM 7358 / NBRC 10748 / NRRL Y-17804) TaxID=698492 RepID=UPI000867B954|nr:uncharacterized protein SAICODRAFT_171909 [Saitoella complicata NRRL Y-17804]ODQ50353.1 hypothetical protein SAICODRAFT_171909 [Saitoella complicata NRRL Y-17804]
MRVWFLPALVVPTQVPVCIADSLYTSPRTGHRFFLLSLRQPYLLGLGFFDFSSSCFLFIAQYTDSYQTYLESTPKPPREPPTAADLKHREDIELDDHFDIASPRKVLIEALDLVEEFCLLWVMRYVSHEARKTKAQEKKMKGWCVGWELSHYRTVMLKFLNHKDRKSHWLQDFLPNVDLATNAIMMARHDDSHRNPLYSDDVVTNLGLALRFVRTWGYSNFPVTDADYYYGRLKNLFDGFISHRS